MALALQCNAVAAWQASDRCLSAVVPPINPSALFDPFFLVQYDLPRSWSMAATCGYGICGPFVAPARWRGEGIKKLFEVAKYGLVPHV
jgi:hypothetical protein